MEEKKTPAQRLGWKVGDLFVLTRNSTAFLAGTIVEFLVDDGSGCPKFKAVGPGPVIESYITLYNLRPFEVHNAEEKGNINPPSPSVLEEAQQIIYGDREETYGKPDKSLRHIAEQWALYLTQKYGVSANISPEDVCYMMADLKKCRQLNSPKRDNIVDGIGYLALVERL